MNPKFQNNFNQKQFIKKPGSKLERVKNAISANDPLALVRFIIQELKFISSKPNTIMYVQQVELFYIAKLRPKELLSNELSSYLSNIDNLQSIYNAKGLPTTLFTIFAKIYIHERRPPLFMAQLLFLDVIGRQEFCNFERAQDAIRRVLLTYFIEQTILSPSSLLYLCKFEKPNLTFPPDSLPSFETPELASSVAALQNKVTQIIRKLDNQQYDSDSLECLQYFFTVPQARELFLKNFSTLEQSYQSIIPVLFKKVYFFLSIINPQDETSTKFLRLFASLTTGRFYEEHRNLLSQIASMNSSYAQIISQYNQSSFNTYNINTLQKFNSIPKNIPALNDIKFLNNQNTQGLPPNIQALRGFQSLGSIHIEKIIGRENLTNYNFLLKILIANIQQQQQQQQQIQIEVQQQQRTFMAQWVQVLVQVTLEDFTRVLQEFEKALKLIEPPLSYIKDFVLLLIQQLPLSLPFGIIKIAFTYSILIQQTHFLINDDEVSTLSLLNFMILLFISIIPEFYNSKSEIEIVFDHLKNAFVPGPLRKYGVPINLF